jgi:hypothetical protein
VVLDPDVLALDEAYFLQALAERSPLVARYVPTAEKPHHRHRRLLRARRERPRERRAAEQRDELAPSHHSIASSARASSVGGTLMPSAFAAIRLTNEVELGRLLDRPTGVENSYFS